MDDSLKQIDRAFNAAEEELPIGGSIEELEQYRRTFLGLHGLMRTLVPSICRLPSEQKLKARQRLDAIYERFGEAIRAVPV